MGADASVIRRSQAALVGAGEPAANVAVVFTLPSRYAMTLWQVRRCCGGAAAVLCRGTRPLLPSRSRPARQASTPRPAPPCPAPEHPRQAFGGAFAFLAPKQWGRSLLLRYPRLFR